MSASPTLTWEQYQQLRPDQRRRPLTDAEFAALTKQQRIAAGLDEDDSGAPADFNGPVFPNPNHVAPQLDTDPTIPVTRLPNGVSFNRENFVGSPRMDVSNPAAADIQPAMGREVSAQFGDGSNSDKTVSSAATVPMFSPDGSLGDVPYEQMVAARAAGAKPGVTVKSPDGKLGVIPADRTQDAVKAGATIVPIQQQETQHPGFWASVANDMKGLLHPSGFSPYPGMDQEAKSAAADQAAQQDQARKAAGYSAPYRALAPVAQAVGVNVPGMEQSAAEGDEAGVYGHAAAPIATVAASEALAHGGPKVSKAASATASAITKAAKATADVVRDVATPENIATAAGGAAGAALGHTVGAPFEAGTGGAIVGRTLGKAIAKRLSSAGEEVPALDATGENEPYAGETAAKPAKVPAKIVKQSKSLGPNAQVQTQSQALAQPRTVVLDPTTGAPEFSDVVAAKQKAAPNAETKPAPAETKPAISETQQATPAPAIEGKGTPAETPGPAASDLLSKLKGIADRIQKQESAAPGSADEDLTQQLQDSLDLVNARKAVNASHAGNIPESGVMTSVAPKDLLARWGVDEKSFAAGREQTRGMKPDESASAIAKLKKAYANGQAVEPLLETRDAANNIVDVDGRGRALAAHQAGVERIPIVVRRLPAEARTQ